MLGILQEAHGVPVQIVQIYSNLQKQQIDYLQNNGGFNDDFCPHLTWSKPAFIVCSNWEGTRVQVWMC